MMIDRDGGVIFGLHFPIHESSQPLVYRGGGGKLSSEYWCFIIKPEHFEHIFSLSHLCLLHNHRKLQMGVKLQKIRKIKFI